MKDKSPADPSQFTAKFSRTNLTQLQIKDGLPGDVAECSLASVRYQSEYLSDLAVLGGVIY